MATKKQKRAAALAKRETFLEEVRAQGLAAQTADRKDREMRSLRYQAAADEINARFQALLDRHPLTKNSKEEDA